MRRFFRVWKCNRLANSEVIGWISLRDWGTLLKELFSCQASLLRKSNAYCSIDCGFSKRETIFLTKSIYNFLFCSDVRCHYIARSVESSLWNSLLCLQISSANQLLVATTKEMNRNFKRLFVKKTNWNYLWNTHNRWTKIIVNSSIKLTLT